VQVNISHGDWQVLRQVLRSKKPSVGSSLRLSLNRRTKDGTFLTEMVRLGMLKVEGKAKDPFEATYSLTERGKHAAEHGVYEVDFEEFKALQG
jgi:hypothetical protein